MQATLCPCASVFSPTQERCQLAIMQVSVYSARSSRLQRVVHPRLIEITVEKHCEVKGAADTTPEAPARELRACNSCPLAQSPVNVLVPDGMVQHKLG